MAVISEVNAASIGSDGERVSLERHELEYIYTIAGKDGGLGDMIVRVYRVRYGVGRGV